MLEPTKKDWKLFREKIPDWQENYMERLVEQYSAFLSEDLPASTKFWELEKRIHNDKKSPGVCIDLRRSTMIWNVAALVRDGVINFDDLEEFSEELKETIRFILER